jgi:uncharacterized protein (UPF0332 family)
VTPGEAGQARSELARADRALADARALLAAGAIESAASRLYYASFHAIRAALIVLGLISKTHAGQIALFTKTYGPAPVLGRLLDLRARADYGLGEPSVSRGALEPEIAETEALLDRCRNIVDEAAAEGGEDPNPPPDY